MFTIEKGVPVPKRFPHSKGYASVVRKLEPGDSVVLPISRPRAHSLLYYLCAKSRDAFNREEYRCAGEGEGTRIWKLQQRA